MNFARKITMLYMCRKRSSESRVNAVAKFKGSLKKGEEGARV